MKLIPVTSSMFMAIGWSPKTKNMVVQFSPDSLYLYEEVSPDIAAEIMYADSQGATFHRLVKSKSISWQKIGLEQALLEE